MLRTHVFYILRSIKQCNAPFFKFFYKLGWNGLREMVWVVGYSKLQIEKGLNNGHYYNSPFVFDNTKDRTQSLTHARQVLYSRATVPGPAFFFNLNRRLRFKCWVSYCIKSLTWPEILINILAKEVSHPSCFLMKLMGKSSKIPKSQDLKCTKNCIHCKAAFLLPSDQIPHSGGWQLTTKRS